MQSIREAVLAGRKIDAIKLYRKGTGAGLKEAKDFVDDLERELGGTEPRMANPANSHSGCAGIIIVVVGFAGLLAKLLGRT